MDPAPRDSMLYKINKHERGNALNAIATGGGGTPALAAAELHPRIAASSQLARYIPFEPRLSDSGLVDGAAPIPDTPFQLVSESGNFNTDVGADVTAIEIRARTIATGRRLTMDYQEDFAFGAAVQEHIDAMVEDAGAQVDGMIMFGDVASTGGAADGSSGNITGKADPVEDNNASQPHRAFDGFAKLAFDSATEAKTAGKLTLEDMMDCLLYTSPSPRDS